MSLVVKILQKNLPLAAGVIVLFFIAACSDIGDRNNIHDYDGFGFSRSTFKVISAWSLV